VSGLKTTSALTHRLMFTGLGELTFLQLSTIYAPSSIAAHCIGYVGPHFMKHNVMLLIIMSFRFTLISQPSNSQQLLRFGNRCSRDCWCISLVGGPWVGRTCGDGGVLGTSAFFLLVDFELFSYVLVPANALHHPTHISFSASHPVFLPRFPWY
jgi:hypothetical protein